MFFLERGKMPQYYEYELAKAAHKLASEMFKLKPGETFVITADTESDPRVVEATAGAAFAVGAKPMVIWTPSPLGVGKVADPMLPVEALTAALNNADVWVEFNNEWLLYSTPYERVMKENKKIRYLNLVGMNVDMMVRLIGRVDLPTLEKFQNRLVELNKAAKHVKVTTPAGGDVELDIDPSARILNRVGYAHTPGSHMLSGQISLRPIPKSVNGRIVFDGSVVPPIGLPKTPIKLSVKEGKIEIIEDGKEALEFDAWLKSFNDPQMLHMAHLSYGVNPGAKLTGNIVEDERVWGCTEWGIGYVSQSLTGGEPIPAASHTDGICLNSSVWLDGKQIYDNGRIVEPELTKLAKKLGKV